MYDEKQGRYSFIAIEPFETLTNTEHAFDQLKKKLARFPLTRDTDLPPFQGGAVGYFSYELLHQIEKVPAKKKDDFQVPELCLGFYDVVAAFDHQLKKAWVISVQDRERADWLANELTRTVAPDPCATPALNWTSDFTRDEYIQSVQKVIDYILAGDIFQANLTQRFQAALPENFNRFSFYENLRLTNPAPFSAYLNFDGFSIASSSPERFLKHQDQQVETCPIKGTRPRHPDPIKDQALIAELSGSEKDHAENTMIVDLLRNDISKVCKPHSVQVPELCEIHSFASVHHLISTVTGEMEDGLEAVDLLEACFPGGSITGAPKVRAMEIISELERCPRGPYCGAIGYIGFDGTMDTNIVIRTALFKDNKVCAQAGGGIVADSIPSAEYEETLDKADGLFRAFSDS